MFPRSDSMSDKPGYHTVSFQVRDKPKGELRPGVQKVMEKVTARIRADASKPRPEKPAPPPKKIKPTLRERLGKIKNKLTEFPEPKKKNG